MNMFGKLATATMMAALPLFSAGHANAAPPTGLAALMQELQSDRSQAANALAAISELQEEAAPILKEGKLWKEQVDALRPQYEAHNQMVAQHNQVAQRADSLVATHNAGCHGSVPPAVYDRCKGEEPYLQSQIDRVHAEKAELDHDGSALDSRRDRIAQRVEQLAGQLEVIETNYEHARSDLEAARHRISVNLQLLGQKCQNGGLTAEEQSYCQQINWDGATEGLPVPPLAPSGTRFFR